MLVFYTNFYRCTGQGMSKKNSKKHFFFSEKIYFPHTPSESGTFPPCGLVEGATFRWRYEKKKYTRLGSKQWMTETAGLPPSASPRALIYLLFWPFLIFPPTWRNILFLLIFKILKDQVIWSYFIFSWIRLYNRRWFWYIIHKTL